MWRTENERWFTAMAKGALKKFWRTRIYDYGECEADILKAYPDLVVITFFDVMDWEIEKYGSCYPEY